MKRPFHSGACLFGAALVTTLCTSGLAHAANPSCAALGVPGTPVYLAGSSAVKPVLKELSATLAALPAAPVRVIYQSVSSCTGLSDVATAKGETATGTWWDDAGTERACDVDAVAGQVPDIGLSDVYASTCDSVTVPANFKDFKGPVQVMTFIAPPSSKETAISAEAALVVFGFGGVGTTVAPWTDKAFLIQRPDTSGTRRMIGKAIGLEIGKWRGTEKKGSGDVLSAVHNADATAPNAGLGILAADFADTNRSGASAIKMLAFQPKGENCSYFPDSSSTTFDKSNVRSGTYPIWGPLHLVAKADNGTTPNSAAAATVVSYFTRTGLDVASKKKMIDNEVAAHTIPWCAMKVTREGEVGVGATTAFAPDEPCGCYFELKANGAAASSCKTCADDTTCGAGKCRYGYCEAK
jgi:ABC-type phosphate transport system substrate-binding protein